MDQISQEQDVRTSAEHIAFSVLRAIAEQRLVPGMRLGEENLAEVFQVSRTVVRQALTQLAAHGIVGVRPKKGWFITEPTDKEIRDIFAARRLLECALIREFVATATPAQIRILEKHLERQHDAIADEDVAKRTHLLTDFHDQIADIMGNAVVSRMVRDLTLRTNLISMLHQTQQEASDSAAEHQQLIRAVKKRDADAAVRLMSEHLTNVEGGLRDRRSADPTDQLREALISTRADRADGNDATGSRVNGKRRARGKRNKKTTS